MSKVDTKFAADERDGLVAEVRSELPAFLHSGAVERANPSGDVRNLLNLASRDLARVTAAHVSLSSIVGDFLRALPLGLRRPITSSVRPRVAVQSVKGLIDWGATIQHRAVIGWDPTQFVVRSAQRVFDTPENRALMWLIERLDALFRDVIPARVDERVGIHNQTWVSEVERRLTALQLARRQSWLRHIPAERPTAATLKRLHAARTSLYRIHVLQTIEYVERLTERPSADDLTELLAERYFEPDRDWLLFEVVVALRLARAFAMRSTDLRRSRLLVGIGQSPYAVYSMPDGGEVRLWYQAWPRTAGSSLHRLASKAYKINAGSLRPDLIIERVDAAQCQGLIIELKASKSVETLAAGLFQLMGYLKDRPKLFHKPTPAWLVAPPSSAFSTEPANNLELWAVDSDVVAAEVCRYFGYRDPLAQAPA